MPEGHPSAEAVRLIEAPVASTADPRSLTYRTITKRLDRAGTPSAIALPADDASDVNIVSSKDAAALSEALLLLEAGCLQAAWSAFRSGSAPVQFRDNPAAEEDDAEWPAYLCSALLWTLRASTLL